MKKKKSDTTQAKRQSKRTARKNEMARRAGYLSWSAYETAVINGVVNIEVKHG